MVQIFQAIIDIVYFYCGILHYIIKWTHFVFVFFTDSGITSFPNLNFSLGILFGFIYFVMTLFSPSICFYWFFIILEIVATDEKKEYSSYKRFINYENFVFSLWFLLIIFILPFIFGLMCFFIYVLFKIFTNIFIWLFSK